MDSLIPPLNFPNINVSEPESGINGNISNLPSEVQIAIKPGQSYLLEILMTEGMGLELGPEIKAQIDVSGQKIPVNIELETPLKLPEKNISEQPIQIRVKINNISEKGQADIKLLSINNEKISRFSVSTPSSANSSQTEGTISPLVFDIAETQNTSEFHPLKIGQMLKNMTTKLHLPNQVGKLLDENFEKAEINASLKMGGNLEAVAKAEGESIKNTLGRIELILKNFTDKINHQKPQTSDVEHFIYQIKNELLPLKNTLLLGTAFSKPDSKLLALRTALGNFLPEKNIKLENLSNVLLEIKDIRFMDFVSPSHLSELSASRQLTQNLPSILDILKEMFGADKMPQSENDKLMDIFKSLHNLGKDDLVKKIVQKFPNFENKIFENTLRFIKGINQHNSEVWLGKEISQDLRTLGQEGQEINRRLGEFMNASIREGGSWKIINLPVITGEQLSRIRLAIKNIQEEEAQNARGKYKKSARFVVDTTFSRLGAFQFDGFSFVKDRQFDLIIRTSNSIDEDLKSNIFRIFKTTLHNLHYSGTIKLNVKENFIKICEDENKEETLKQGLYV